MSNKIILLSLLATLGCVLGNSIISRRSYPMVGTNHCTWGPSYWCGHISRAKECGTLKHCAAVWGKQPLNNPTETCETCEYFVSGAQKLHAKKISPTKIGLYMNTLCYQQSGKAKDKCLEDIGQYLTEVLQLLDLGLTPRAVCYSINLCPQQKPTKSLAANITTTKVVATTTSVAPTTTKKDNKICHDCQVFFNDVRERLRSNETVKNVEDLFYSTICVSLGPFKDMCRQLIDAFVPVYLEDVSEFVDPGFLCSILSFCPATQKTALFEALSKISLESTVKMSDAKECSNCKLFIKNIKKEVDSDTTVAKLKEVLKKDICSHLGGYESICDMAVDTYAKEILDDILNNVDESVICKKLGLCNGYVVMSSLVSHLKAVKFSKQNPFQESTECELCKVLMSELHSLVEDKNVQNAVKDFLNNEVCVRLGDMKEACLTLVKEYEPLIMKAIQGLLEPNSSCAMLGMCSSLSASKSDVKTPMANTIPLIRLTPAAAFVPYERVGLVLPPKTEIKTGDSEQCKICKMVMGELEKVLKDKAVQKDIEEALDEVCSLLPGSMSKQCADFVNEYTPGIINLLLSQIQPKMVCSALQLCAGVSVVPDATGCSYCSEILGIASGHLDANPSMNKKEFEDMLLKLCNKYGEQYKDVCEPGVQQFGDTIYKALKNDIAPREVCGMISFCASSVIKPETKHYLGVMCELLKSAGVTTECKEFNEISKEVNKNFLNVLLKKAGPKETNALKSKSGIGCTVCEEFINYLKSFAVSKMTQDELKKLLHEACHFLEPRGLRKECDVIVNKYETELIHLLVQELSPKEVCEALSLCKSSTLYFKPSKHHNPCDLGIHYWCSSYAAAVKCKAIGVCSSKVWNKNI